VVYRWAYDYSVPGVKADFIPQNVAPGEVAAEAWVEKAAGRNEA
jgi:cytochrome c oxidase subunit I